MRRIKKNKLTQEINASEKILNLILNLFINESNMIANPKPAEIQQEYKKKPSVLKPLNSPGLSKK
ncbi:hypothetical protein [Flavobacterium chilense]|uniref:hypothetical protein n=1 Tax=Flavobacterium chilense TaxID=946677 RepID=UPI00083AFBB2|nr:hypothetical protein [Flavobacterium chilense]